MKQEEQERDLVIIKGCLNKKNEISFLSSISFGAFLSDDNPIVKLRIPLFTFLFWY